MLLELTQRYSEPHRHYHTLEHIAYMFELARRWQVEVSDNQTMAIWWHDAIYVPGASDNEYESVKRLYEVLPYADTTIGRIILDTKEHKPVMPESHLVLDLDMAILGADPLKYRKYAKQVRKEFKSIPDELYKAGRVDFLHKTIKDAENDKLFFTKQGRALTQQAIENMHWEVKQLQENKL